MFFVTINTIAFLYRSSAILASSSRIFSIFLCSKGLLKGPFILTQIFTNVAYIKRQYIFSLLRCLESPVQWWTNVGRIDALDLRRKCMVLACKIPSGLIVVCIKYIIFNVIKYWNSKYCYQSNSKLLTNIKPENGQKKNRE